jgi:cytochrome c oxidase subunit 4
MAGHNNHHNNGSGNHHEEEVHITPLSTYIKVAAALFALTFLTVTAHIYEAHYLSLAPFIAFGIAAVKALLVMAWFMHLKYEEPSNRLIFAMGFFFLAVLFAFSVIDIFTRVPQGTIL